MAQDSVIAKYMSFEKLEDPNCLLMRASNSVQTELEECIKKSAAVVVLEGLRRAGKTQALKLLSRRNLGVPAVFIDICKNFFQGSGLVDEAVFRQRWLRCIEEQLGWKVIDTSTVPLSQFLFQTLDPLGTLGGVLVLDEFDVASLTLGSSSLSALFLSACSLAKVVLIVAGTSLLGMSTALHGHAAIQPLYIYMTGRVTGEEFAFHFPAFNFPVMMHGVELTFTDFQGVPGHLAILGKYGPEVLLAALLDRLKIDDVIHTHIATTKGIPLKYIARDLLVLCAAPSSLYQPKLVLLSTEQLVHLQAAKEVVATESGYTFSSKPLRVALRTHYERLVLSEDCDLHEQIRIAGDPSTVGFSLDHARARVLSKTSTFSSGGIEVVLKPAVYIDDAELELADKTVAPNTPYLERPGGPAQAGSDAWFVHEKHITFLQNRAPRVEFTNNGPKDDLPKILKKAADIVQRHVAGEQDGEQDAKAPEVFGVRVGDEGKLPFDKLDLGKDTVTGLTIEFAGRSFQIDVFYLTFGGMAEQLPSRLAFVHPLANEADFKVLFGEYWASFVRNEIVQSYLIRTQTTSPGESWSEVKVTVSRHLCGKARDSVITRFVHKDCPFRVLHAAVLKVAVANKWPTRGVLTPPEAGRAEYMWSSGAFVPGSVHAQRTILGLDLNFQ
jgi:hypothetical protein